MREITERDIDILRNEQGEIVVTKDFKAEFYKFIVDHFLCKFHFSICTWHIWSLSWLLNTAQPGKSRTHVCGESPSGDSRESWARKEQAGGELGREEFESGASKEQASGKSASGELQASARTSVAQVFEFERKNLKEKKFSLLQKLMRKICRDKAWGHDEAWILLGVEKMKLTTFGLLSESSENYFIAEPSEKYDNTHNLKYAVFMSWEWWQRHHAVENCPTGMAIQNEQLDF